MIPEAADHLAYMLMATNRDGDLGQQITQGIWAPSRYEATAEYWSWLNRGIPKSEGKAVAESLRAAANKGKGKGKASTKRTRSDGPKGGKRTSHGHKGSPPPPPLCCSGPCPPGASQLALRTLSNDHCSSS